MERLPNGFHASQPGSQVLSDEPAVAFFLPGTDARTEALFPKNGGVE